jgi:hypothetical protein
VVLPNPGPRRADPNPALAEPRAKRPQARESERSLREAPSTPQTRRTHRFQSRERSGRRPARASGCYGKRPQHRNPGAPAVFRAASEAGRRPARASGCYGKRPQHRNPGAPAVFRAASEAAAGRESERLLREAPSTPQPRRARRFQSRERSGRRPRERAVATGSALNTATPARPPFSEPRAKRPKAARASGCYGKRPQHRNPGAPAVFRAASEAAAGRESERSTTASGRVVAEGVVAGGDPSRSQAAAVCSRPALTAHSGRGSAEPRPPARGSESSPCRAASEAGRRPARASGRYGKRPPRETQHRQSRERSGPKPRSDARRFQSRERSGRRPRERAVASGSAGRKRPLRAASEAATGRESERSLREAPSTPQPRRARRFQSRERSGRRPRERAVRPRIHTRRPKRAALAPDLHRP